MKLAKPLWSCCCCCTSSILHALDLLGRLLGLAKGHLPALAVLAAEKSVNRCIKPIPAVKKLQLHDENKTEKITTDLLNEVAGCHGRATCERQFTLAL